MPAWLVDQMFAERGLAYRTVVEADQEAAMIELIQSEVARGLMRQRIAASALRKSLSPKAVPARRAAVAEISLGFFLHPS